MSRRFILSRPAALDLDEILSFVLQQDGAERARHVADHLRDAFRTLADNPRLGHTREDLTDLPVRFWTVWSFLVIYKAQTQPLEIVRVLHGARDIEALLDDAE